MSGAKLSHHDKLAARLPTSLAGADLHLDAPATDRHGLEPDAGVIHVAK